MESETCLFLAEWEAVRGKAHAVRRKWAEDELCRQQLQIQCGSTSLQSWLSVMETQKKVLEGAAAATAQALSEVESHWRPVRLEATDGGPASWLLSAEQAKVASLKARAAQWTAAVPAGGSDLRKRQQALSDHVQGQVVSAVRGWDQTHAAAEAAWLSHHQRVEETTRAIAQDKAPPDSWLSEVRYREQARKHLSEQAAAEELLLGAASKLHDLEAERVASLHQKGRCVLPYLPHRVHITRVTREWDRKEVQVIFQSRLNRAQSHAKPYIVFSQCEDVITLKALNAVSSSQTAISKADARVWFPVCQTKHSEHPTPKPNYANPQKRFSSHLSSKPCSSN